MQTYAQWTKEVDIASYIRNKLNSLKLLEKQDFNEQDASPYIREMLKHASKNHVSNDTSQTTSKNASEILSNDMPKALKNQKAPKANRGIPDFVIEKYNIPIFIECKRYDKKSNLFKLNKDNEKVYDFSQNAISNFAINGAIHYARIFLKNSATFSNKDTPKSKEAYSNANSNQAALAIGIAGSSPLDIGLKICYVFDNTSLTYKEINITQANTKDPLQALNILENPQVFNQFIEEQCILTEEDKNSLRFRAKQHLAKHTSNLNKLMHSHNITAPQRVLYVAGMILSMQSVTHRIYNIPTSGLSLENLQGLQDEGQRDGEIIYNRIKEFLEAKVKDKAKLQLMLDSFNEIRKDKDRDKIFENFTYKIGTNTSPNHSSVSHILEKPSSINKQIFAYIYHYIYKEIDGFNGHLDIMGECYSEFLKYALGDGSELGIVLTPPHVTNMMAKILNITHEDKVMDLATGSAGFLISSMEVMIESAYKYYGKHTVKANEAILKLKTNSLLGVEYNAEMFALATSNMILRGDGSSKIHKANTFETSNSIDYKHFKPTRILLNPPFTWEAKGLPFMEFGLEKMEKHGLGAIIIQDSAGSGQAAEVAKRILKNHTLKASIKMPSDLFQPMAGVQTSIYIFEAKVPHDFDTPVKFIDFRNDGYKIVKKGLVEVDNPSQRYRDILTIYKKGLTAQIDNSRYKEPININEIYVEDCISDKGNDWNFDQHKKIDTTPKLEDFKKCVSEYLAWEVATVLKQGGAEGKASSPRLIELEEAFKQNGGIWKEFRLGELFDIDNLWVYGKNRQYKTRFNEPDNETIPVISGITINNGVNYYTKDADIPPSEIFEDSLTISTRGEYSGTITYHDGKFVLANNILVMCLPKEWSKRSKLYLAALMSKLGYGGYSGYPRKETLKNDYISLPTLHDALALDYMQDFIKELEAQRIKELEAYLSVTGLSDTTLTDAEKQALNTFEKSLKEQKLDLASKKALKEQKAQRVAPTLLTQEAWENFANDALSILASNKLEHLPPTSLDSISWKEFRLGELFEIGTGSLLDMQDLHQGNIPRISAKSDNNGVLGYFDTELNSQARHCENFISVNFLAMCFTTPIKQV